MSLLNLSVKHGQTPEVARANFEKGIAAAQAQFATWIRQVDWSDDRTAAKLSGPGFTIDMSVDAEHVHAKGDLPVFARILEGPIKAFLQKTFAKPLPP